MCGPPDIPYAAGQPCFSTSALAGHLRCNGPTAKTVPTGDVWVADVATRTTTRRLARDGEDPIFSPDGQWIAASITPGWVRSSLALLRSDGTEHRVLFQDFASLSLEWAPARPDYFMPNR